MDIKNMNFSRVLFFISLLFSTNLLAKYYFAESKVRTERILFSYTIKQFDSSDDFNFVKKISFDRVKQIETSVSPHGKYLAVQLFKKRKQSDELVIFTTDGLIEKVRIKISKPLPIVYNGALYYPPIIDETEKFVYLKLKDKRKQATIYCYNIESGELVFSLPMDDFDSFFIDTKDANIIILTNKRNKYFSAYNIYHSETGKLLNRVGTSKTREKGRLSYRYLVHNKSISLIRKQRKKGKDKYFLLLLDEYTGQTTNEIELGNSEPILTENDKDLDFSYLTYRKGRKIEIVHFDNSQAKKVISITSDLRLKRIITNFKNRFLLTSSKEMIVLDLEKPKEYIKQKSPFDIRSGFFTEDNSKIFIIEGVGSDVALLDFETKSTIARTSTGRVGVKIAKIFATTTLLGLYNGYYSFFYDHSDFFKTDDEEKKLFVINEKTNDVTILNIWDFSGKSIVAIESDALAVIKLNKRFFPNHQDRNIIVFGLNSILYFNGQGSSAINQIKFKELVDIDPEENLLFVKDSDNNIVAYQLSTGKLIVKLNKTKNAYVLYFKHEHVGNIIL